MGIIRAGIVGGGGGLSQASGTFTPELWDTSLSGDESQTYTEQTGLYRKIGDVCEFWLEIEMLSLGTLTTGSNAFIGGLPFTAAAANTSYPVFVGSGINLNLAAANPLTGLVIQGSTRIVVYKWSGTTGISNMSIAEVSADGRLTISGSYLVAP